MHVVLKRRLAAKRVGDTLTPPERVVTSSGDPVAALGFAVPVVGGWWGSVEIQRRTRRPVGASVWSDPELTALRPAIGLAPAAALVGAVCVAAAVAEADLDGFWVDYLLLVVVISIAGAYFSVLGTPFSWRHPSMWLTIHYLFGVLVVLYWGSFYLKAIYVVIGAPLAVVLLERIRQSAIRARVDELVVEGRTADLLERYGPAMRPVLDWKAGSKLELTSPLR